MITVPKGIFAAGFDRLTMTGHAELVEGWTPYAQIISALCIGNGKAYSSPYGVQGVGTGLL